MRNITRRSILSTTAAAAVIPAAALSAVIPQAASDTEILAAIDAHRRAYNNPIWAREDYTDAEADEASDATQEAEKVLLATPPASRTTDWAIAALGDERMRV